MKKPLISLLVMGLLISTSFGLVLMGHMVGQGHAGCPFAVVGIVDCAQVRSPLAFVISHLNALNKFFSAIPANSFAMYLAMLLVLVFAAPFGFSKKFESLTLQPVFTGSRIREFFVSPHRILFNHWFALHENSPAFMSGR